MAELKPPTAAMLTLQVAVCPTFTVAVKFIAVTEKSAPVPVREMVCLRKPRNLNLTCCALAGLDAL